MVDQKKWEEVVKGELWLGMVGGVASSDGGQETAMVGGERERWVVSGMVGGDVKNSRWDQER